LCEAERSKTAGDEDRVGVLGLEKEWSESFCDEGWAEDVGFEGSFE